MGIYKISRKKEKKHAFDQEKSKTQEKEKENRLTTKKKKVRKQDLDYAIDQEKKV